MGELHWRVSCATCCRLLVFSPRGCRKTYTAWERLLLSSGCASHYNGINENRLELYLQGPAGPEEKGRQTPQCKARCALKLARAPAKQPHLRRVAAPPCHAISRRAQRLGANRESGSNRVRRGRGKARHVRSVKLTSYKRTAFAAHTQQSEVTDGRPRLGANCGASPAQTGSVAKRGPAGLQATLRCHKCHES